MNLRNLFRFRYYRKLVCSFVLIGVLLVSMAVVCISIMFSRMTVKRVGEMSVSSVRQVADSLDTLLENCQNAADILMNERYFTSVAGSYTLDRLKEYALMSSIMKLKINYPYIRHMGIVNGRLDRYVGTRGVYFGCEDSIKEADLSQENQHYAIFARNVREYENTEESKKISVLTYLYEPYSFRGTGSYIVMDLDLAAMRDQLKLIDSEVWEQIALLNGEGSETGVGGLGGRNPGRRRERLLFRRLRRDQAAGVLLPPVRDSLVHRGDPALGQYRLRLYGHTVDFPYWRGFSHCALCDPQCFLLKLYL